MNEAMYDIVKRLFDSTHEWVAIDIGPIAGSQHLSLEQHAGFEPGQLVLRLDAEPSGEFYFDLDDFRTARQLAHGLLGWADFAENALTDVKHEFSTFASSENAAQPAPSGWSPDALVTAANAIIDFYNGPVEAKRPDIFQRLMQRLANALPPALTAPPAPSDDPECTCCRGTGITLQTERRCSCQAAQREPKEDER